LIIIKSLAFASLALYAATATAQTRDKGEIEVTQAWMRATPPGAKVAAGYMTVRNKSAQPDRLVAATSLSAGAVQTHVHIKDGEILRMREVKGYDIPAKGALELRPGGAHLMLVDLKQPLKEGDKVPVTLRFERAGEVKVDFRVEALTAQRPSHQH
jgi:periplasmic copper chaperone A